MFDKVQKGRLLTNLEKERGAAQSASSAVQRLYHVQLDLRRIFLTHDSCCHFRSGDTKVSPTCSTLLYPEIEVQRGTGKCGKNALTFFNTAFICIPSAFQGFGSSQHVPGCPRCCDSADRPRQVKSFWLSRPRCQPLHWMHFSVQHTTLHVHTFSSFAGHVFSISTLSLSLPLSLYLCNHLQLVCFSFRSESITVTLIHFAGIRSLSSEKQTSRA